MFPFWKKKNSEDKLEIRDTHKYGMGVYAKAKIKKGDIIRVMSGEEVCSTTCDKAIREALLRDDNPLQVGFGQYLILDEISRTFNHSCNPNAGIKNKSTLFALRDINAGEEITYDYSTTEDFASNWEMPCNCGSINCRKTIGNILSIPTGTLNTYITEGALQDYLKENILETDNN